VTVTKDETLFAAMRVAKPGGPLGVEHLTLCEPEPDEVTVRLRYASVNPLDRYILAATAISASGLPRTLGVEGVGEVEGQWYVVYGGELGKTRDGTWAEYVTVPHDVLVPVPVGLDLRLAACAGVVGATAVRVTCDLAEVNPEDRVLVLGAGGGAGTAITSLSRSRGACVWGQVGSPAKAEAVLRADAVPVVATSAGELRRQVSGLGITVAFDALGGDYTATLVEALSIGGRLISYGVAAGSRANLSMRSVCLKNLTLRGYGAIAEPPARVRADIRTALDYLVSGQLDIPIDRVLPLAEADRALAALANREIIGKVLLDTRGESSC
jgi:NADPH2:quinone reductase